MATGIAVPRLIDEDWCLCPMSKLTAADRAKAGGNAKRRVRLPRYVLLNPKRLGEERE